MSLRDKLITIANKIRDISGISKTMNLDAMAVNLNTIQSNISDAFVVIESKGGTTPSLQTSLNLANAIQTIPDGVQLNFEIVGSENEPAAPRENMIWINTNVPITSYIFDVSAPSSPLPDMIWIKIGTSSDIAFDALKGSGIKIYPKSAKQYIEDQWVDKEAETYLNGEWYNWVTGLWAGEMYIEGTDYTWFTGGWEAVGLAGTDEGYFYNAGLPILTKNSTNMTASISYNEDDRQYRSGVVRTINTIPLTAYNTLKFIGKGSANNGYVRLLVLSADCTRFENAVKTEIITTTSKTYTIDISDLDGSYYIAVMVEADTGKSPVTCTINSILLT